AKGRETYEGHVLAQCGRCHEGGGEGVQAGPVLDGIGRRHDPLYLLESLIDPSANMAQGYENWQIVTAEGDQFFGRLIKQTAESWTLHSADGMKHVLPVEDITQSKLVSVSSMPPMGGVLSAFELRDLVAYLQQKK
ncbi:MAG: heme-binding protein, partial [Verrucomicrobiota bacterium]|nr:heme-binding protein [Verrucomicrobiota bacterium]